MKKSLCFLPLLFSLFYSCSQTHKKRISINGGVYMLDSIKQNKIFNYVENYLLTRDSVYYNGIKKWTSSSGASWIYPDTEIWNIEDNEYLNVKGYYNTSIISFLEVGKDTFEIKLAFIHGSTDGENVLRAIYNLIITEIKSEFSLIPQTNFYTKNWKSMRLGQINFIYPINHPFNETLANKTCQFNIEMAKYFDIPPQQFDYYICENAKQVFQIIGFDYNPEMFYTNQKYARADLTNFKIYNGTNSEWYPHEIVHLYTQKLIGSNTHRLFNEGIATYLGGSQGYNLEYHLKTLKKYLHENKNTNLNNLLENDFSLNDTTNMFYAVGGLLCKVVNDTSGKQKMFEMITNTSNNTDCYNNIYKALGLKREELHSFILNQLSKY